jgi:hypothetical protein
VSWSHDSDSSITVIAAQAPTLYLAAGQRSSIAFMISSAHLTASAIALTVAGTLFPPSNCASFRAARIPATIANTRLRPSSTVLFQQFRFWFAIMKTGVGIVQSCWNDVSTMTFRLTFRLHLTG